MTSSPSTPARWHGPVAASFWLLFVYGVTTWLVGRVADEGWTTAVGAQLRQVGWITGAVGLVGFLAVRGPTRLGGRKALILAVGLWPFFAFGDFLAWQIMMTQEQEALCEGGDAERCHALGVRKQRREGPEVALPYFERACTLEHADACFAGGSILARAQNAPQEAFDRLERACALGRALACSEAGRLARRSPAIELSNEALHALFQQACEHGIANACAERDQLVTASP